MPPLLGYWNMRGIAQPARLMLKYAGVEFEEKLYDGKDPSSADEWFKEEKFNLGLDFPNLPYYIDGNIKITQSQAIYKHIARKYNLYGASEEEKIAIDMVNEQLTDFKENFYKLIYYSKDKEDYEANKKVYAENLPALLKPFEKFLGEKLFVSGDKISYVDFVLYEVLDGQVALIPGCLADFPKLTAFKQRIEALPAIKKYMESPKFIKSPRNGYIAFFPG